MSKGSVALHIAMYICTVAMYVHIRMYVHTLAKYTLGHMYVSTYNDIHTAIIVNCSAPKNLENGMSNCSKDQNYFYEDTCHFICNTGYEMMGSNIMMCLSNGSWSGSETKCQRG